VCRCLGKELLPVVAAGRLAGWLDVHPA